MGRLKKTDVFPMMVLIILMSFFDGIPEAAGKDPVSGVSDPVIVIDPGHGGLDSGGVGHDGLREKEVTLVLARQIAAKLTSGYRVLLTRSGDYAVDGADRVALANHNHADLFISLHIGSGFSRRREAMVVFVHGLTSATAGNTSLFQPKGEGRDDARILWDKAQDSHHYQAKAFAMILDRICRQTPDLACRIRSESLAVLQGADMPAVMLEIGCLSDPLWEKQLLQPERLAALSEVICRAVKQFFRPDSRSWR